MEPAKVPNNSDGIRRSSSGSLHGIVGEDGNTHARHIHDSIPIATIGRVMQRRLPAYRRINDNARQAMADCTLEFIRLVTNEAAQRCLSEHRKILSAEDILWAMEGMGFDDYIEPLTLYLNRYRQAQSEQDQVFVPAMTNSQVAPSPVGEQARVVSLQLDGSSRTRFSGHTWGGASSSSSMQAFRPNSERDNV